MACNCIDEMEVKLQERTGDSEAFISAVFDFEKRFRRFNCKGYYQRKKSVRNPKGNLMLSYIPFDHCPFCGKKYMEEEQK